ncbi:MAG: hypothetical protein NVS1B7_6220 [Candidatus Saccharimonadales bacterium]
MWDTVRIKQDKQGFTIVELLIVIVVIGILAALVINTFVGIQQKARDTKRQTDIRALYSQAEAYYTQNGKYPTLANFNDATWRANNIKGLDQEALKDPRSNSYVLVAAPVVNSYAYAVSASDGTACDNSTKDCVQYTLTATLESGGTFVRTNLN